VAGGIVPTPAHSYLKFMHPREIESSCDIVSIFTTRDHGWSAVDEGIEAMACFVVFIILREQEETG
jgi:hypothetical protein